MDELLLKLGLKLLAFSVLFVGLSKAAQAIRGRPKAPGGKDGHRPDPWEPKPETPKPSAGDLGATETRPLTAQELDRLCEARAQLREVPASSETGSSVRRTPP